MATNYLTWVTIFIFAMTLCTTLLCDVVCVQLAGKYKHPFQLQITETIQIDNYRLNTTFSLFSLT